VRSLQSLAFILLLGALQTGCLFDSGELWRQGRYSVAWIDTSENLELYRDVGEKGDGGSIGLIDAVVLAVGINDNYVIAKRRPTTSQTPIQFYVLDRSKDTLAADRVDFITGPLTASEFMALKQVLGLPEFSKHF